MAEGAKAELPPITIEGMLIELDETIWRALTEADLIAQWFMPNDFSPDVGHKFTFRTQPVGPWDGVSEGEVLAAEPFWRLQYSWRGGSHELEGFGRYIDTVLTWTLSPLPNGTHVRLEHAGFTKDNAAVYAMMSSENGWALVVNRLAKVVTDLAQEG
ncbi:MAG: SRPBCC domain-containing protein [Methylovirgula sp.]